MTVSEAPPISVAYVIVGDGLELRPLVDAAGERITFVSRGSPQDAIRDAVDYLRTRFGRPGPAPRWRRLRPGANRIVLVDRPLRPGEAPSEYRG